MNPASRLHATRGTSEPPGIPGRFKWCETNGVELVFTPTYASWANPIEAHFGLLRQFVISNSDHRALARAIRSYVRWRNAHTRDPRALDAERRHRARILSEAQRRWGHPKPIAA